jgi:hypothetical protein
MDERKITQKFINFIKRDFSANSVVVTAFLAIFVLFLAGIIEKATGLDDTVDFLKLFEVWINIFILALLLVQKNVITYGDITLKVFYSIGLLALNFGVLLNLSILIIIRNSPNFGSDDQDDTPVSWIPANYDYITMAVTLFTDIMYLYLYIRFKAMKPIVITSVLIFIEVIIIGVATTLNTDMAIDITNLVLALITCTMAVMMWTAKITLNEQGQPKEFNNFFSRADLEENEQFVSPVGLDGKSGSADKDIEVV